MATVRQVASGHLGHAGTPRTRDRKRLRAIAGRVSEEALRRATNLRFQRASCCSFAREPLAVARRVYERYLHAVEVWAAWQG